MKMINQKIVTLLAVFSLFISSCNSTKYLAENERLYDGGKVELKVDTGVANDRKVAFEESLGSMLRPEPNAKILGWRWKLSLWNMGGGPDTTTNFIRRWLRRQGEKPVLLSDVNREYNENLLRNRLENRGFLG